MVHHNHRLDRIDTFVEMNKLKNKENHLEKYVFDMQDFQLKRKKIISKCVLFLHLILLTNRMVYLVVHENNQEHKHLDVDIQSNLHAWIIDYSIP